MNDNISRQSAIDALGDKPLAWTEGEYELGLRNQWESDINALQELPSIDAVEVVLCKDCMHNGSYDTDCPIYWNGKEYCSFGEREE